jgi:hypothetical protein
MTWGNAAARAVAMLAASYLLFAVIPDRVLTYLAIRTTPTVRDLLVTLTWAVSLGVAFWVFHLLQPRRKD